MRKDSSVPQFTDEETVAQRKWATYPGSRHLSVAELGFLWLWSPGLVSYTAHPPNQE